MENGKWETENGNVLRAPSRKSELFPPLLHLPRHPTQPRYFCVEHARPARTTNPCRRAGKDRKSRIPLGQMQAPAAAQV